MKYLFPRVYNYRYTKAQKVEGQPMMEVIKDLSSIINITGKKGRMVTMCVNFYATTKFIRFYSPCWETLLVCQAGNSNLALLMASYQ